jgi:hypothetical protein
MKQIIKRIGLVILLVLSYANVVLADQRIEQRNIGWFSSPTSNLLNRSSLELATNHVIRGIRFAHRSLEGNLNPMDELIANHNLCMGYLALDKSDTSAQYCKRTFKLAQGPYSIEKIRGAYLLQESNGIGDSRTTLTPMLMVASNILQQNSQTRLTVLFDQQKKKQSFN